MTAKHPMIPFPVIVRAADGDIEAVNQIVRHYSGFIASRSMRPMKDEYENTHMVVDETLSCGSMDKPMLPRQSLPVY